MLITDQYLTCYKLVDVSVHHLHMYRSFEVSALIMASLPRKVVYY